jgi:hypothetical protein
MHRAVEGRGSQINSPRSSTARRNYTAAPLGVLTLKFEVWVFEIWGFHFYSIIDQYPKEIRHAQQTWSAHLERQ